MPDSRLPTPSLINLNRYVLEKAKIMNTIPVLTLLQGMVLSSVIRFVIPVNSGIHGEQNGNNPG